jgi:hypothetical protein
MEGLQMSIYDLKAITMDEEDVSCDQNNKKVMEESTTTPEDSKKAIEVPKDIKLENKESNKKIYTGENDEEVLNCEGNPCNFVYDDIREDNDEI